MNPINNAQGLINEADDRLDSITRILARARPDQAEPLDADAMLEGADALLCDARQALTVAIEFLNRAQENVK